MRRALASLLLAVHSFPLVEGFLFADSESKLPSCCRRGGRHHCAMMAQSEEPAGIAIASPARCASWPKAEVRFTDFQGAVAATNLRAETLVCNRIVLQVFVSRPLPQSDSSLTRGPPSRLF
jgi:hypothetical protein